MLSYHEPRQILIKIKPIRVLNFASGMTDAGDKNEIEHL
jgi:hypothetical protein